MPTQAVRRSQFSRGYHSALQAYLNNDARGDLEPAREFGRQAVLLGFDTLELARIHEIAMSALVLSEMSSGPGPTDEARPVEPHLSQLNHRETLLARSGVFFAEALTPIEQTHRGALEANLHLNQIIKALSHRTVELADSNEELRLEILLRKSTEATLRTSDEATGLLLENSQRTQEELRLLSRELLSIQEEERRRISRELHDVIAQTLAGINVQLSNLKAESSVSTRELQQKISNTQRMVQESVEVVHRFARELRPSVLDDLGLIPALKSYLKTYFEETGIRVSLATFAEIEQCSGEKRTVLFRITQEALTNVVRHAGATRVEINITRDAKGVSMEITDNGHGFVMENEAGIKRSQRLGILGMRERTEMVGGTFSISSTPHHGTTVWVSIPSNVAFTPPPQSRPQPASV